MQTKRLSGFYKLSVDERRKVAAQSLDLNLHELIETLESGGLDVTTADNTIENALGKFALPLGLGLHVTINDQDYLAPMAVEEPSVIAAASNAAKIIGQAGGFHAESDPPWMISQIHLDEVVDAAQARSQLLAHRAELLQLADRAIPGLVTRGGGARDLEVRDLGQGMLVVHFLVDCRDAMGANLVNTVAEAVADRVAELAQGQVGLRILSNLADRRCVHVRCAIPHENLAFDAYTGEAVRDGIVRASRFAEVDPYRAATHNKGIMNGVDAVVIATGNDWRSVEAGAHAYAARNGRYEPLCVWKKGPHGQLLGELKMPMALGTVGGPSRVHTGALLGLKLTRVRSAQELGMLVAAVGMASNLAALRALSTDGIQRGHMALHARSVAMAAGAQSHEVERVAAEIHAQKDVTLATAKRVLARLDGRLLTADAADALLDALAGE